ncbi:MAG TPA: D-Ala-D-Ala carboxypeptidase family metallohydrolase [Candidatus Dormibacteraeota bacterium]|nr:D-Ala-D-Ala carboxypeptidase family metallohydrolase [Candidatus Dormibacteraeota bacterium]
MQLSENFTREEFELEGPMPEECVPAFTFLAEQILEPIRQKFGEAMEVTSGYRTPEGNADAHGNAHSEHIATESYCAADWKIASLHADMRAVFDWIRLSSGLPFHIVTLEHGQSGDVIHISWNRDAFSTGEREAKEGATHNASGYIGWAVA